MVFAPKGAKGLSPGFRVCLAPATWPEGPAPKGQQSLAQGLPWVGGNKRFALKGLEVWSCFPGRYLMAPSGLVRVGEITHGKPWAKLFWPLRATDWAASCLWTGAKHVQIAWLLSACPSGSKAIRPSKRLTIMLALMGLRPKAEPVAPPASGQSKASRLTFGLNSSECPNSRAGSNKPAQSSSKNRPQRERLPFLKFGIPVVKEIELAIVVATGERFDLSESKGVKWSWIFVEGDLDDDSVLAAFLVDCNNFRGNGKHLRRMLSGFFLGAGIERLGGVREEMVAPFPVEVEHHARPDGRIRD